MERTGSQHKPGLRRLLLPGTGAAADQRPQATCLQVSPVLSLEGLIASRKGDFRKGTNLGGLHQPPNQHNKTKLEQEKKQEKKKPYKATRITNRKPSNVQLATKLYQENSRVFFPCLYKIQVKSWNHAAPISASVTTKPPSEASKINAKQFLGEIALKSPIQGWSGGGAQLPRTHLHC